MKWKPTFKSAVAAAFVFALAIVGSQPFGGEGLSGTGPKAGGPRYLHRFATERVVSKDTTAAGGNAALMTLGDV